MTRQAGGRGDEHQPDDAAELAEVRQVLLARVVLEVRVGHERADRVEDHAGVGAGVLDARGVLVAQRPERALAVGVQRQVLLGVEQAEGEDEQRGVEGQEGEGVPLPVHPAGSRRPSRRQRNIGRASRPRPARSARESSERNIDQPSGNEAAIGRPKRPERMQPGDGQIPRKVSWSCRRSVQKRSGRIMAYTEVDQRGHGQDGGQVEHGERLLVVDGQSRSHAATRPKNRANSAIPRASVARATAFSFPELRKVNHHIR